MDFTFTGALDELGADAAFRLINEARPPQAYPFAQILPERPSTSYKIDRGSMTVRTIMAGLVGMDSPYSEGAVIDVAKFLEESAKLGHAVDLPEGAIRTLQDLFMRLQLSGGDMPRAAIEEVLNFTNALLIQPHLDAAEWLRGQALSTGAIDWTFNKKRIEVNYGVPSANKPAARTGTSGYGGTASKFWDDHKAARKALKQNVRVILTSRTTLDMIVSNQANNLLVLNETNNSITIRRMISQNGTNTQSSDARETLTIVAVDLEGEILDPDNQGKTKTVPMMPDGKVVYIGANTGTQYRVGAGSRAPVDYELGYTHLAPTVEGGGRPGRWARVFVPENRPWALRGESAANLLPVIEAPEKIYILTTEMV